MQREQHLLVVEDCSDMLESMMMLLQHGLRDVHITGTHSCREARNVFTSAPVDVAVLDLRMPDFEGKYGITDAGLDLLQWIKEHHPSTEVIIFTAYSTVETAVRAFKLGAFDYLSKEDGPTDLMGSVRAALTGGDPTHSPARIMESHLSLQLAQHASSVLGCPVEVSVSLSSDDQLRVHASTWALRRAEAPTQSGPCNTAYTMSFGVREARRSISGETLTVSRRCRPTVKTWSDGKEAELQLAGIIVVPLPTDRGVRGVISIFPRAQFRVTTRKRAAFHVIADFASLYLEHMNYAERARRAELQARRLGRNTDYGPEGLPSPTTGDTVKPSLVEFGKMIAGIRHDLIAALGIIDTTIALLLRDVAAKGRSHDALRRMSVANRYCNLLLGNLSDLVQHTKRETKALDVRALLDDVLDIVASRITPAIRLRKEYQKVPTIRGDRAQVQRAFMNLIENALQAMASGGDLVVTVRYCCADDAGAERGAVLVEIADTGTGIAEEDLPRICDLSFSTKREGYGLGLYIVNQIVAAHLGTVSVKTQRGEGTVFTLRFPTEETVT